MQENRKPPPTAFSKELRGEEDDPAQASGEDVVKKDARVRGRVHEHAPPQRIRQKGSVRRDDAILDFVKRIGTERPAYRMRWLAATVSKEIKKPA